MVIFDYIEFTESDRSNSSMKKNLVTIYPEEYEHAIKNPLKGFRASGQDHEYSTLMKSYIKWNELENSAQDGIDKIKEFVTSNGRELKKRI